ncbi:MAG: TonB-dependent receptor [Cellvibrionaceae bacterium]|nr:TonB-dependent receptor [Cellvibrionaceae bacterium]
MLSNLFAPKKPLALAIALSCTGFAPFVNAQAGEIEEVMVTGSYIKGSPGDAALPVQVMGREDLDAIGATTVADVISKLAISSGSENQSDSFTQGSTQGTENINLRGLGLSSTLVLINGRRQTISGALANDGSVFVDTSTIPAEALERVEVLKEGAASTYGSDAIAGVVNFILRKDFEGLEVNVGYQTTHADSQEDKDIGFIWGGGNEKTHFTVSGHFLDRSPLNASKRPEYSNLAISGAGATFLPVLPTTVADGPYAGDYQRLQSVPLAGCGDIPETVVLPVPNGARCGFYYGGRFNFVNTEKRRQLYTNLTHEFDNGMTLFAEAGWANNDVEDNPQSPSYPYLAFPLIMPNHPSNPFGVPVVWFGRPFGAESPSPISPRENETARYSINLSGEFDNGWSYDTALSYSENRYRAIQPDVVKSRLDAALAGRGGPSGDQFFDPFVAANNSQEMIDWLRTVSDTERNTDLLVWDAVVAGDLFEMGGGNAGFAFGLQARSESFKVDANEEYLVTFDQNGAPIPVDYTFLGGVSQEDVDRNSFAIFAETKLPISDALEVTAALRYEKLDNDNSLDPKLAVRWQLSEQWIMRGSVSTSFREPSLSQLNATAVNLEGIQDFNADGTPKGTPTFIRVAGRGAADLQPEESTNYNFGLIYQPTDELELKLDYWRVDYQDLITQQSAQGIVFSNPNSPAVVRSDTGQLLGVNTRYFNSSEVEVDGLDFEALWTFADAWSLKANVSHFLNYDLTLANGQVVEAAGKFNYNNFARSLPETKANVILGWLGESQRANLVLNYISSYETTRDNIPAGESSTIDSYLTVDAQYAVNLDLGMSEDSTTTLTFGVKNLLDEDAPRLYDAANYSYDSKQHSPLGRVWYMKAKFNF